MDNMTGIKACFDGAWPKRESGRTYNSPSGFGSLTGMKSGKVLAYGTRNKLCDYEVGRNVEKLSPYGSSQRNESSNAVVASKAPKSRNYGTTESYDFRAAIGQKNIGTSCISSVYKQLHLSPASTGKK
ncbi:hypothetical protein R5R35_008908 [Gryllus longicercus]|uniref:Mutator-like transposase domain-containing protein n=1 Tax=Gryllus longicercus TaxID=2509291 RepID=A0AAN9W1D9_9ORTH